MNSQPRTHLVTFNWQAFKMGAIIGYAHVAWYACKCLFLIPINIIKDGVIFRYKHGKPLSFDLMHRIMVRTMVANADDYVFDWYINPMLRKKGDVMPIANCPNRNTIEHANVKLGKEDTALVFKNPSAESETDISVPMKWFVKPDAFDPKKDRVIYYIHGGGFRVYEVPGIILALGHIHEAFPEAAIVLVDYTLTSPAKHAVFPQQLLESIAGYEWLTVENGFENILLMGDSAGGNLSLALLEFLEQSHRPLPLKTALISPWVNPSLHEEDIFAKHEVIDYLPAQKIMEWGHYYTPGPEYINNPFLNIEHNFEADVWNNILEKTSILVTYGSDEMFHQQIKRFIEKLKQANPSKFSIEDNVVIDEDGAHTSPLYFTKLNLKYWLSYEINQKFIRFLTSS